MPTPKLLLFLFWVTALAGGFRTVRRLITSRRSDTPLNAMHAWTEVSLPSWKYEPFSVAAILIHLLAISVLSFTALNATTNPSDFNDTGVLSSTNIVIMVWIAEGGSISLVGYMLGSLAAFPVASLIKIPVINAITRDGVVHGRTLMPWVWFSHFSIDRNSGLLRLYSAYTPDMPCFVSNPSESVPLDALKKTLQEYLPANSANGNRPWYRTKHLLIPTMILVCLPFVAAGCLASRLSRELALFAITLLTAILSVLGGQIISLFAFGILRIKNQTSL